MGTSPCPDQPFETDRELFEHVKRHLLRQGKQSIDGTTCMYRGDNGTSCAAGCLIPDRVFDTLYMPECNYISGLSYRFEQLRPYVGDPGSKRLWLVERLQGVHDNGNIEDWERELDVVWRSYELRGD